MPLTSTWNGKTTETECTYDHTTCSATSVLVPGPVLLQSSILYSGPNGHRGRTSFDLDFLAALVSFAMSTVSSGRFTSSETRRRSFSMPAHATMTPLSVQSLGGGATRVMGGLLFAHNSARASLTAWFAATPPTTASDRTAGLAPLPKAALPFPPSSPPPPPSSATPTPLPPRKPSSPLLIAPSTTKGGEGMSFLALLISARPTALLLAVSLVAMSSALVRRSVRCRIATRWKDAARSARTWYGSSPEASSTFTFLAWEFRKFASYRV
mmetsp:Transcript_15401/g.26227  ORF Transcript_15401/g.26227 Transcript_15401/m.26227 type:complete len:268 (+) Transcript_15401:165-968(+)